MDRADGADERNGRTIQCEFSTGMMEQCIKDGDGGVDGGGKKRIHICIYKNTPIPYVCPLNEYDKYKMMYELGLVSEEIYINCNSVLLSIKYRYLLA